MCVNVSVYVCQCVYMHPGWSLEIFVGENVYTINKNKTKSFNHRAGTDFK